MKHSQEEINKVWKDLKDGKYESVFGITPVIVSDDEIEEAVSIPYADGMKRQVYVRYHGSDRWEEDPESGRYR